MEERFAVALLLWKIVTWGIDTTGKLAPFAIAFLVYSMNLRQNTRANAIAFRAAVAEDQKLRLALLDRRLRVLDTLREVTQQSLSNGQPTAGIITKAFEAVREAELVYNDALAEPLRKAAQEMIRWQSAENTFMRNRDMMDDATQTEMISSILDRGHSVVQELMALERSLTAASRVHLPPAEESLGANPTGRGP